jgi:hypothetical protein
VEGESLISSDLYAPTLKAPEARLLAAIAAEHGCPLLKTETRQAFLYEEVEEDEKVYIRRPSCWLEPIPDGHVLLLLKTESQACTARNRPPYNDIFASQTGWSSMITLR